ncbi:MAG: hypothetical protein ACYCZX_19210 [Rhodospirillaceae bacterium]
MVFISRLNRNSTMSDKIKASSKEKAADAQGEKPAADPAPTSADVAAIEQAALSRVAGGRSGKREAATMKLNPAFDSWLEGKLNKIFDTASTEPLPQDLVKLLEKIDQADAANKKKS